MSTETLRYGGKGWCRDGSTSPKRNEATFVHLVEEKLMTCMAYDKDTDKYMTGIRVGDFNATNFYRYFRLGGKLGQGASAKVFMGTIKKKGVGGGSMVCAIRRVRKVLLKKKKRQALFRMVKILGELNHPNVVSIYQFYPYDPAYYYVVLEYMLGGELFDRIVKKDTYNEREVRAVMKVLVETVDYLHTRDIVHRDLKPSNILLASAEGDGISGLKIADFSMAMSVKDGPITTKGGDPEYNAPEMLLGNPYLTEPDMWSIGLIAYILLTGKHPFFDHNATRMFNQVAAGGYQFEPEDWTNTSIDAKDFISKLLVVDQDQRMTAEEAKIHPWLLASDQTLEIRDLGQSLRQFKVFNAKTKLRAAIKTVLAARRMFSWLPTNEFSKSYELREVLGKGTYGTVYKATPITPESFAEPEETGAEDSVGAPRVYAVKKIEREGLSAKEELQIVAEYERLGVSLKAYMDDISLHFKNITAENIQVIPDLVDELEAVGIIVNRGKCAVLPPPGHIVTLEERRLLGEAGLPIAAEGITVVGVPIGTDAYIEDYAMRTITDGGADKLARMLARMPDKQVAHLVTAQSLTQRSGYLERGVNHKLSEKACERLDNTVLWVLEATMELRDAEDEEEFFQNGCQADNFKLKPYQQAQARLSTGNLSMDIVVRPGALSNASSPEYRNKGILLDVTHADPQAQASIMHELNHPNLVKIYDFFEDDPKSFYMVLELMNGGELFDRIVQKKYYNEAEARDVCRTLLEAMRYTHGQGIVHRDLKPENLLLADPSDDSSIRVADFGFAVSVRDGYVRDQCGTPGYVAPEILRARPYGTSVDMWSVGVIIFIILSGCPPFHDKDQNRLFRKIKAGHFSFYPEYWSEVSSNAKDLIRKLLVVDPKQRITAAEACEHPWLSTARGKLIEHDLSPRLEQLKNFIAKRKLRAAIRSVHFLVKLDLGGEKVFSWLR
eukprot:g18261.t1